MTLTTRLDELIRACFTGLWLQSFEHEDAALDIARLCHTQQWRFAAWDVDRGLALANDSAAAPTKDPLVVLRSLPSLVAPESTTVISAACRSRRREIDFRKCLPNSRSVKR